jgi:hypothetical protein
MNLFSSLYYVCGDIIHRFPGMLKGHLDHVLLSVIDITEKSQLL